MRTLHPLTKWIGAIALFFTAGCGEAWVNLTASLGGNTSGGRGSVGVIVLNNTSHQAVFTLGSYDQTSGEDVPDFQQYVLDGDLVLKGSADGGLLSFDCARVFSIGGPRLLALIGSSDPEGASPEALIEGVEFFSVDDVDPDAQPASQGFAAPFEVLLGVDFPCNALLIFKFEVNDAGPQPFRVDFELIPSANTR